MGLDKATFKQLVSNAAIKIVELFFASSYVMFDGIGKDGAINLCMQLSLQKL